MARCNRVLKSLLRTNKSAAVGSWQRCANPTGRVEFLGKSGRCEIRSANVEFALGRQDPPGRDATHLAADPS
jgi:hypothetical protein